MSKINLSNKFWADLKKTVTKPAPRANGSLVDLVKKILTRRRDFDALVKKYQTPFYILDLPALRSDVNSFQKSFAKYLPGMEIFYAMKVNSHPDLLRTVVAEGLNIEVSSGRELKMALRAGAKKILFTGPGKSVEELRLALRHRDKVTVNIDSFGELRRLGELSDKSKQNIRAGVRVYTSLHGRWNKFGIPVSELYNFWLEARKYPFVSLQGLQFHSSWNKSAQPYVKMIAEIAGVLSLDFDQSMLAEIKFIDFGGGFYPDRTEGYWEKDLPSEQIKDLVGDGSEDASVENMRYYVTDSVTLDVYARDISVALKKYFGKLLKCKYYTEPGRIIVNSAMHMVFSVVDKKTANRAVLDGGINMTGWEKYLYDYNPVINLSRPSLKEIRCDLFGNLCMADDILGRYCFGKSVEEGDVLLLPNQGAFSYAMAQNFIRAIPPVYVIK